jgi:transcriptional regulator with XRE-family HTH domain
MSIFSRRLRDLRIRRNLTREHLCKELQISLTGYANYEQGKREPDFDRLYEISDFYDVSFDYLFGFTKIHNQNDSSLKIELNDFFPFDDEKNNMSIQLDGVTLTENELHSLILYLRIAREMEQTVLKPST